MTHSELTSLLDYEMSTGHFYWAGPARVRVKRGARAGFRNSRGQMVLSIKGKRYAQTRVAWFYVMGWWPEQPVGNRDGDITNVAWSNLVLKKGALPLTRRRPTHSEVAHAS